MPEEVFGNSGPTSVGPGNGDVVGPAGATPNAIVRYNGATGKAIKDSLVLISDTGVLDIGASADLFLNRRAAATLNLGGIDAAVPVAQKIATQGSRAGTDVDVAGASLTIQSGLGTGIGSPSRLSLAVPSIGVTGSAAQVPLSKIILTNKVYAMPDATPVDLFTVTLATANTGAAVVMTYTYNVTNGANAGSHTGIVVWSFCNNGGTVTGSVTDVGETFTGTGAGAGVDTYTIGIAGTVATARASFNTPLNVAGTLTYQILNNSASNLTIL